MMKVCISLIAIIVNSCSVAGSHKKDDANLKAVVVEGIITTETEPQRVAGVSIYLEGVRYGYPEPRFFWLKNEECTSLKFYLKSDSPLYSSIGRGATEIILHTKADSVGNYSLTIPGRIMNNVLGYRKRGDPKFSFLRLVFNKEGYQAVALPVAPDCSELMENLKHVRLKKLSQ
jgi:hypothetical protein